MTLPLSGLLLEHSSDIKQDLQGSIRNRKYFLRETLPIRNVL